MRAPAIVVLALAAPALAGQAQQPPVFQGGVELIEVDVNVTDGRGEPVADLHGPEFAVTVDGRVRRVLSSQFVSLRSAEPSARPAGELEAADDTISSNANTQRGRLIVIAVDRESIGFGHGRGAMQAAGRFLDKLGAHDKVALLTVPAGGPSTDFTTNHQVIRHALERATGLADRPTTRLDIGIFEAYAVDQQTDAFTIATVMRRLCGNLQSLSAREQCGIDVRVQASAIVREMQNRVRVALGQLRQVLRGLANVSGPKSLVWISEGLTLDGTSGELAAITELASASRTTISVVFLDSALTDISQATPSPSERQDREMAIRGMEMLSAATGGVIYRASVGIDFAFDRLERELSGYYLLGVESSPSDQDGKAHRISVTTRRSGVTVRARREFNAVSAAAAAGRTPEERVLRALASPFGATDFPVRMTTFAYQDENASRVRIVIAAEVGPSDVTTGNLLLAYELLDADGRSVTTQPRRETLTPLATAKGQVFQHAAAVVVDPGTYAVKLAAVDERGRRASVERTVKAWQMADLPFAFSDLTVADPVFGPNAKAAQTVEARLTSSRLLAYFELYSNQADHLADAGVRVEVASEAEGPTLAQGDVEIRAFGGSNRRVAALVPIDSLPPGRYVARATITRGATIVGRLTRPFERVATSVTAPPPLSTMLSGPSPFVPRTATTAEVLGTVMDLLETRRPALKTIAAQVRTGRLDGVARQAFDADDELAAMFLRGLELFAKGDLNQAATQFGNAQRMAPDFTPAAFYLGACYAAGGRDREAANWWLRAMGTGSPSAFEVRALADALLRLGEPAGAIEPLTKAVAAWPADDDLRRRLAVAYALGQRSRDAVMTIEPYLDRHPEDQEALLLAMHQVYGAHLSGQSLLGADRDRERMTAWARAYGAAQGSERAMVELWAAYVAAH